MPVQKHIHKYQIRNLGGRKKPRKIFLCGFPNCSHHIPEGNEKSLIGKESICNECEQKFLLTYDQVRRKRWKPRCQACIKKDKLTPEKVEQIQVEDKAIENFLENALSLMRK